MRCKKHPSDLSSSVGVCATCLRERLITLIAAQSQAQQQPQLARVASRASVASDEHPQKSDPNPPPLVFPRSVSPYVSRRKSDCANWHGHDHRDRLFYSTPQVGPTYYGSDSGGVPANGRTASWKKKTGKFWILPNLFKFRSDKFESDPRVSSQDSCEPSSSASPSWFSTIFPSRRKNPTKMGSLEDSAVKGRRIYRQDRGMSPATTNNFNDNCDGGDRSPSASGYSSEASPRWRNTPMVAPASARRSRQWYGKNVSGMSFCLSPLVRPSPNHHWNTKGLAPELTASGEIRSTPKPNLSTAASFCANRSRKLADFGRFNQNR